MYDLISIGNISIDLFFQGESLTHTGNRFNLALGGKYLVDHFYETLGGGGANVAIGVTKHGLKTAIIGVIGNNQFKPIILKHLKDHDVSSEFCNYKDEYQKISSILLSPSGERTIINYETPHEHIFEKTEDFLRIKDAKMIYMSNLPRVSLQERVHVLTYLHANGIPVILNLGIKDCRRPAHQILPLINKSGMLIVNAHEFSELIKHSYERIDFNRDVRKYIHSSYDSLLIVTDGEKGSYCYYKNQVYFMRAMLATKVLDTTGAGDAYTAGFIAGYFKHKGDVVGAMESGARYAVKIIEKVGAN